MLVFKIYVVLHFSGGNEFHNIKTVEKVNKFIIFIILVHFFTNDQIVIKLNTHILIGIFNWLIYM